MENATTILVIDDDKFIHKVIRNALVVEGFELIYAHDGAEGLELASEKKPNIIILDIEMPNMNGYEVCEQLKQNEDTQEIPVVFLSSHTDLRARMQGYEAGAEDYLVKPFEKEDLVAKMRVLCKFLETQNSLKEVYFDAKEVARIALTTTSELSLAMQFVENSYSYVNYTDLAQALLISFAQFDTDCVLMVNDDKETLWFSSDGNITPLEQEMLEMAERDKRFIDFGMRTIVNYQNLSALVRNMPLDNMERYGRLKDLFPVLMSAADVKINSIKAETATANQSLEVMETFGKIRGKLYFLAKTLIESQQQSNQILEGMVTELNTDLLRMGLEEDQEAQLLGQLDSTIAKVNGKLDNSDMLHSIFSDVLSNLKEIAARQEELHNVFVEMNSIPINDITDVDDSIELF